MARVTRRQLIRELEKFEPPIARAFLEAFANVRNQASVAQIAGLIEAGRADDIADALGINAARFAELTEQVRNAYVGGAKQGIKELPILYSDPLALGSTARRARVYVNFDLRNMRAERWLADESSKLVTEIVEDQRAAIRAAVSRGTSLGQNPRRTALDLVGRIGTNGRRSGGVVGLTSQQEQFVSRARAELASGDPAQMKRYLGRTRRDKRLDGIVNRAIKAKKPVSADDIEKMVGRYSDKLLQLRGENIARTEAITAFNEAREEAFRQAADTGAISPKNVKKVWSSTGDGRTRESHSALNGKEVGLNDPFDSPTGAKMLHPGDTSLGAGGEDVINCRCMVTYRVDHIAEAKSGR